jgi:hypothetical protein
MSESVEEAIARYQTMNREELEAELEAIRAENREIRRLLYERTTPIELQVEDALAGRRPYEEK